MTVIGTFTPTKDGYAGTIRTLTLNSEVQIVATKIRKNEKMPQFRVLAGHTEIGAAWRRTKEGSQDNYLRIVLNDPLFPRPVWCALLEATEDGIARLVWMPALRNDEVE
jgi:uncharacterized protein (DUF736 family)